MMLNDQAIKERARVKCRMITSFSDSASYDSPSFIYGFIEGFKEGQLNVDDGLMRDISAIELETIDKLVKRCNSAMRALKFLQGLFMALSLLFVGLIIYIAVKP